MGQYLAIGVTYEIHVNKANSVKRIEDLESLKNGIIPFSRVADFC